MDTHASRCCSSYTWTQGHTYFICFPHSSCFSLNKCTMTKQRAAVKLNVINKVLTQPHPSGLRLNMLIPPYIKTLWINMSNKDNSSVKRLWMYPNNWDNCLISDFMSRREDFIHTCQTLNFLHEYNQHLFPFLSSLESRLSNTRSLRWAQSQRLKL